MVRASFNQLLSSLLITFMVQTILSGLFHISNSISMRGKHVVTSQECHHLWGFLLFLTWWHPRSRLTHKHIRSLDSLSCSLCIDTVASTVSTVSDVSAVAVTINNNTIPCSLSFSLIVKAWEWPSTRSMLSTINEYLLSASDACALPLCLYRVH